MKNQQRGNTVLELLIVIFWLAFIIGYVMNIVQIVGMVNAPTITGLFILKCVGIFLAPLGAILGFV